MSEAINTGPENQMGDNLAATGKHVLQPWMDAFLVLSLAGTIQERLEKCIEEFDNDFQRRLFRIGKRT